VAFYKAFGADVPDGTVRVAGREYSFRVPARWLVAQRIAMQKALESMRGANLTAEPDEGPAEYDARVRPVFADLVIAVLGDDSDLMAALLDPEQMPLTDVQAVWVYLCNPTDDAEAGNPLAKLRAAPTPAATKSIGVELRPASPPAAG
jgi:hypothetical protein